MGNTVTMGTAITDTDTVMAITEGTAAMANKAKAMSPT